MDAQVQALDAATFTRYIDDLKALQAGVEKLTGLSLAGSTLGKAVGSVISIVDAMKATPMGLAWKAVKTIPGVVTVYEAALGLREAMGQIGGTLAALRQQTPVVIKALEEQQAGQAAPPGYSGQLYAMASAVPEVRKGFQHLHDLIGTSKRAAGGLRGVGSNLSGVRAVGQFADRLCEAIARLEASLDETETTLKSVSEALEKTDAWLPAYQVENRKPVTASTGCQMSLQTGLFKKELCQKVVTSFDDEAPATCSACHIAVCEQHRVAVPGAAGSTVRNTWLCLQCAKQHR